MIRTRAAALALVVALIPALTPTVGSAATDSVVTDSVVTDSVATGPVNTGPALTTLDDVGSVGLEITGISPVVAAPGQPVTITGALDVDELGIDLSRPLPTPTTDTDQMADGTDGDEPEVVPPADRVDLPPVAIIEVRVGTQPTSGAAVSAWAESTAPSPGRLLISHPVTAATDPSINRLPFSITLADLEPYVSDPYGALPISVQVYLPDEVAPVRVRHTFLGFQARKEYAPLGLTFVLPFVLPPDVALVGEFGDNRASAWETLLGPGGLLAEQLAGASGPGITWAIDPVLLEPGPALAATTQEPNGDEATGNGTSAEGATTGTADPATTATTDPQATETEPSEPPGPATRERAVREAYARDLLQAVRGRDVIVLPRHDADLGVLPAADATGDAADSIRALLTPALDVGAAEEHLVEAGADVHRVAWPVDGRWTAGQDAGLRALAGGADWGVLVADDSIDGGSVTDDSMDSLIGAGGSVLLAYDGGLGARATRTVLGEGGFTAGMTLMADTLITLNERPGTPRHRFVVLGRDTVTDPPVNVTATTAALADVPWLTLDRIPAGTREAELTPTSEELEGTAAPTDPPALTEARAIELADTLEQLPSAAALRVGTGVDLATRGADTLAQLTSARWRTLSPDWDVAYQPLAETVRSTFTAIRIPARDISFLADSGLLRVTVENDLDDGIRNAVMELSVDHPILRIESGPQPVDVGADSRTTVAFEASALASGRVTVTAVVRTEDGVVLGEPTTFSVRVSPTSDWIYWLVGGIAGLVILVGVARTVLRRPSTD